MMKFLKKIVVLLLLCQVGMVSHALAASRPSASQAEKKVSLLDRSPFDSKDAIVRWLSDDKDFLALTGPAQAAVLKLLAEDYNIGGTSCFLRQTVGEQLRGCTNAAMRVGVLKKYIKETFALLGIENATLNGRLADRLASRYLEEEVSEQKQLAAETGLSKEEIIKSQEAARLAEAELAHSKMIKEAQERVARERRELEALKPFDQWNATDFWTWTVTKVPALLSEPDVAIIAERNITLYEKHPKKFESRDALSMYLTILGLRPFRQQLILNKYTEIVAFRQQEEAAKRAAQAQQAKVAATTGKSEKASGKEEGKASAAPTISFIAQCIQSGITLPVEMVQQVFNDYWAACVQNQWKQPITTEKGEQSNFRTELYNKTENKEDFAYCTRLFLPSTASNQCELIDIGDIHGSKNIGKAFETWVALGYMRDNFEIIGNRIYVFNGDYVDRGPHSIETICLVLLLKIHNWNRVVLIRGNHEVDGVAAFYGFLAELTAKYNDRGSKLLANADTGSVSLSDIYKTLPCMALIGQGSQDDAAHSSWQLFFHGFVVPGAVGFVKKMIDDYGRAVGYYQVQVCGRGGERIDYTDLTQRTLSDKAIASHNTAIALSPAPFLTKLADNFVFAEQGDALLGGLADQVFVARLYELNPTLVYAWRGHQHNKMCTAFLRPDVYEAIVTKYPVLLKRLEEISYKGRVSLGVDGPFELPGLITIIEDFRKLEKASAQQQSASTQACDVAVVTTEDLREFITTYDLSRYPELSKVMTLSAATDLTADYAGIPWFSYVKIKLEDDKKVSESRPTRCVCEWHKIRSTQRQAAASLLLAQQAAQLVDTSNDENLLLDDNKDTKVLSVDAGQMGSFLTGDQPVGHDDDMAMAIKLSLEDPQAKKEAEQKAKEAAQYEKEMLQKAMAASLSEAEEKRKKEEQATSGEDAHVEAPVAAVAQPAQQHQEDKDPFSFTHFFSDMKKAAEEAKVAKAAAEARRKEAQAQDAIGGGASSAGLSSTIVPAVRSSGDDKKGASEQADAALEPLTLQRSDVQARGLKRSLPASDNLARIGDEHKKLKTEAAQKEASTTDDGSWICPGTPTVPCGARNVKTAKVCTHCFLYHGQLSDLCVLDESTNVDDVDPNDLAQALDMSMHSSDNVSMAKAEEKKVASRAVVQSAPSDWACSVCTFANKPANALCEICGVGQRPDGSVSMVSTVAMRDWSCKRCERLNKAASAHCESCGTWKVKPSGAQPWVCPTCTYRNSADIALCEMCSSRGDEKKASERKQ